MSRQSLRLTATLLLLALAAMVAIVGCRPGTQSDPTLEPPTEINEVVDVWLRLSESDLNADDIAILEVWNSLSQQFVERETLDASALSEAAIKAMLEVVSEGAALDPVALSGAAIEAMLDIVDDPYTVYLDPEQFDRYLESNRGEFEGIGARVDLIDGRITIVAPIPGTPAARAGIMAGDVILEVDGVSTEGWSLIESVSRVRGPRGTPVRLLLERAGSPEPATVEVVRDAISIESVRWSMIEQGVAHLEITTFALNTDEKFTQALEEIIEQDVESIVLDLRNNPGGSLDTTINVASEFLSDDLILYLVHGNGDRHDFEAAEDGLALDIPLVVLVNEQSASGSEVLAAALQDLERAILVGTTTFGKGSANLAKSLSDGSGLYFTTGRWYSPNGRLIEGRGLDPDVFIAEPPIGDDDPQLERALEELETIAEAASR